MMPDTILLVYLQCKLVKLLAIQACEKYSHDQYLFPHYSPGTLPQIGLSFVFHPWYSISEFLFFYSKYNLQYINEDLNPSQTS